MKRPACFLLFISPVSKQNEVFYILAIHDYWDCLTISNIIAFGHKDIFYSIYKCNNSLYLPWAFQSKDGCFGDGPLVLAPVLVATPAPLLLLVGNFCLCHCLDCFLYDFYSCLWDRLGHHLSIFHAFLLLLGLPCVRLSYWNCLLFSSALIQP